jgi:hypothetical protein
MSIGGWPDEGNLEPGMTERCRWQPNGGPVADNINFCFVLPDDALFARTCTAPASKEWQP